ncbi:hypothetical protein FHS27_002286 [Rhodopirellula rubra]|uniref:Uncharacterized protein n=1 Tax=Aporhodopirellula rubra TaxID=980271 RepID=A0A7W5DZG6_9BACT|nr:hypothetical protein [Aporhodopirellula rubra]
MTWFWANSLKNRDVTPYTEPADPCDNTRDRVRIEYICGPGFPLLDLTSQLSLL